MTVDVGLIIWGALASSITIYYYALHLFVAAGLFSGATWRKMEQPTMDEERWLHQQPYRREPFSTATRSLVLLHAEHSFLLLVIVEC